MTNNNEVTDMFKEELAMGAEEAVVDEGSEVVLNLADDMLGNWGKMVLNSTTGREGGKIVFGLLIYFLVKAGMTPDIEVAEGKIARVARVVARNGVRNLLKPNLRKIRKHLEEMGDIAEALPDKDKKEE